MWPMWNRRRPSGMVAVAGMLTLALALAVASCHAARGGGAGGASGGFSISERAEAGPITAMAVKPPSLWAAGAPGLRRFDVTTGEYESVGEPNDPRTRALTAIAIDEDGAAWTAGVRG